MFAIYGTSGQMFQGPFEELRRVAPTLRTARIRALDPDRDHPDVVDQHVASKPGGTGLRQGTAQALHAYAAVQNPQEQRHPLSRVADVMTWEPVLLADTATVLEAWQRLAAEGLGQAPVVNAQGRLVGLLTRAELQSPERLPQPDGNSLVWRALMVQPVTELMVSPVPSVSPDTDLRRLALALLETGLPGLPVVAADGVVIGFVSRTDILRAVTHDPPLDLWAG